MDNLARQLTRNFWCDIERHHPGLDTLHLPADVAAAWKESFRTRVQRRRGPAGSIEETGVERADRAMISIAVRAFYLDIARWATEEPARWGPWVAPCPIKAAGTADRKRLTWTKARMDQRTRERLPMLEAFARAAADHHRLRAAHLAVARATPPGAVFTLDGATYTRGTNPAGAAARDAHGRLVHLDRVEHRAFWAWATVEFLRHTGARVEEMLEISHHAMIQYRLPTTGEIVPLLQIAPSKTDVERVLLVSPELADVLATIIRRVRDPKTGLIPLVTRYDAEERQWNPPAPLLIQYDRGGEPSTLNSQTIREILKETVAFMGLTDATGRPLHFTPQDFRRMFITDAIRTGLPPHIAQVIAGHANINTTMGYNVVYPTETIEAHRAFITRRRTLCPAEEYRTPTDAEWEDFLGHFERRKLSVGTCARAYGTACIHEHACVRCSLLRPDPAQRGRLVEIRDNLLDRIAEAEREPGGPRPAGQGRADRSRGENGPSARRRPDHRLGPGSLPRHVPGEGQSVDRGQGRGRSRGEGRAGRAAHRRRRPDGGPARQRRASPQPKGHRRKGQHLPEPRTRPEACRKEAHRRVAAVANQGRAVREGHQGRRHSMTCLTWV